ncbi:hypothetical protein D3C85_1727620 [compost metagenome]
MLVVEDDAAVARVRPEPGADAFSDLERNSLKVRRCMTPDVVAELGNLRMRHAMHFSYMKLVHSVVAHRQATLD